MFPKEGEMYMVLAALRSELNEGWVWLTDAGFEQRSVVKITNRKNGKSIYCENLRIDRNFLFEYNKRPRISIKKNEKTVVMNEWYRKRLGEIETQKKHDLQIVSANVLWGKFRACIGHPQVVVRLATWLALISVALGGFGVILTIC